MVTVAFTGVDGRGVFNPEIEIIIVIVVGANGSRLNDVDLDILRLCSNPDLLSR